MHFRKLAHRYPVLGPWLWVGCIIQWFIVQYVAAIAWPTGFSLRRNFISDLGNTVCGLRLQGYVCSPLHGLMNLTLVIVGLALGLGAILIFATFARTKANSLALVLLCTSGFGTAAVGLVPENVSPWLHNAIAATCLIAFALGVTAVYWVQDVSRPWQRYSLVCGSVAILALSVLGLGVHTPLGLGGIERLADYTLDLWIATFGVYMLRRLRPTGNYRPAR